MAFLWDWFTGVLKGLGLMNKSGTIFIYNYYSNLEPGYLFEPYTPPSIEQINNRTI